ncbi:MAG: hypothetical protein ACTSU7_00300 [Candidatus Heimdallarchaeaceae archaeon]
MTLGTINIIRGNTVPFNIAFTDSDSVAIDITGYEVWFTVRKSVPKTSVKSDTDALISKKYTNGGADGIIAVEITPTESDIDPGNYVYDIQYKKTDDSIYSLSSAEFIVAGDITRDS